MIYWKVLKKGFTWVAGINHIDLTCQVNEVIRPYVLLLLFRNVPGVYIKDLIPGSVASLDGQLQIDDRILEVNSDDLSILSQEHAANHIQVHIFKFLIKF